MNYYYWIDNRVVSENGRIVEYLKISTDFCTSDKNRGFGGHKFFLSREAMEGNDEFVTALHNGEKYQYRKVTSFEDYGLPKQFQDCSYILK